MKEEIFIGKLAYHLDEPYLIVKDKNGSCSSCCFDDEGVCTRKYQPTLVDGTRVSCSDHRIIFKKDFKIGKKKLLIL